MSRNVNLNNKFSCDINVDVNPTHIESFLRRVLKIIANILCKYNLYGMSFDLDILFVYPIYPFIFFYCDESYAKRLATAK